MSELVLSGVWSPPLKNVTRPFPVGLHVVLGAPVDGTSELVEVCAGLRRLRRGQVRLDGQDPSDTPSLRQRIASLLANETGGAARRDVRSWVDELGQRRQFDAGAELERFGFDLPLTRPLGSLSVAERQALALALALGQPNPRLVLLHDPLRAAREPANEPVLERVRELATRCIVLLTTPSIADARRLGGTLHVLERGVFVRTPSHAWPSALTPGLDAWLLVDCDRPRDLLAALAHSPDVEQARYDAGLAARRVQVRGSDLERLAVAVSRAGLAAGAGIRSLRLEVPDLEAVHGASAGLAHAAYRAAQSPGRPRGPSSGEGSPLLDVSRTRSSATTT